MVIICGKCTIFEQEKNQIMLTLFKNARVFAPESLGTKDILTGGKLILAVRDRIEVQAGLEVEVVDCEGLWLVP